MALPPALVIAQNIHQPQTGPVQVLSGQPFQIVPGVDDIVPVHQQVLFSLEAGLETLPGPFLPGRGFGGGGKGPGLNGAIGPGEDSLQLPFHFSAVSVAHSGPGNALVLVLLSSLLRRPPAGV